MQADPTCKYLTQRFPALVAAWARGSLSKLPKSVELESPELLAQPLRADFILHLPDENVTLHLEFQTTFTADLPLRMFRYYARLLDRYPQRTIEQTIIVLKPGGAAIQDEYRDGRAALRFRVVKLWEEDGPTLAATVGLLPFAVLARWGDRDALEEAGKQLAQLQPRPLRADLTFCTALMARLQFDQAQIARYFVEAVMIESPLYQEVEARGEVIGTVKGKAEALLQMVALRFGAVPEPVQALVDAAREQHDLATLDALLEAAVRAPTVDALADAAQTLRNRL